MKLHRQNLYFRALFLTHSYVKLISQCFAIISIRILSTITLSQVISLEFLNW